MADKKNGKDKFYKKPKPKIIQGGKRPSPYSKLDLDKRYLSKPELEELKKRDLERMTKEFRKDKALSNKKKKVTDISTRKAKQLAGLIPKDLSKKALIARIAGVYIGGLYTAYELTKYLGKRAEKKLKKIRQEKGTKHLGLKKQKKAYGGKVNTYSSPRRTTYKE